MAICVIGAGIAGLSTAVVIQERMPSGQSVTIIAEKTGPGTTSYGSGGQICPFPPKGIEPELGRQICKDSSDFFYKLAFSDKAKDAGMSVVNGFQLTNDKNFPVLHSLWNVKEMDRSAKQMLDKADEYKYGFTATCVFVDLPVYMEWLTDRFKDNGGKLIIGKIHKLEELHGQYDIVVNCTGLGAKQLFNDPLLHPVRGQTVHVHAPWVKTFVRAESKTVIFPFTHSVFIGSTKQMGQDELTVSHQDTHTLVDNATKLFPPLKGARLLWEWVGLRPFREPVRLEGEIISLDGGQLKVVHNYGHGSIGISLSHGCAIQAAKIVQQMLIQTKPSKL